MYAQMLNPLFDEIKGVATRTDDPVAIVASVRSHTDRLQCGGRPLVRSRQPGCIAQSESCIHRQHTRVHAAYEAGKLTWDQTKKQNELNIRKLFYGLLLQQENLKVQETSLENARQRASQAEINFKNGIVPEISMLQAQVSYENQRPNIDKMEQTVSQQLDTFVFLLGMPVGTKIQLDGKIDPQFVQLNADELYEKYGSMNPDVVSLKKNIDILKMQLSALNFKSFTPALSLGMVDAAGNQRYYVRLERQRQLVRQRQSAPYRSLDFIRYAVVFRKQAAGP
jgi:hypothetical protein